MTVGTYSLDQVKLWQKSTDLSDWVCYCLLQYFCFFNQEEQVLPNVALTLSLSHYVLFLFMWVLSYLHLLLTYLGLT